MIYYINGKPISKTVIFQFVFTVNSIEEKRVSMKLMIGQKLKQPRTKSYLSFVQPSFTISGTEVKSYAKKEEISFSSNTSTMALWLRFLEVTLKN